MRNMMRVDLEIRNIDLANVLRNYADRQLRFVLSRFGHRVERVVVTLSYVNGQGNANNCHISVDLLPFGQVAAEEADPDLHGAIDRAVGRLGRLLTSRLGRERDEIHTAELRDGRKGARETRSRPPRRSSRRSMPKASLQKNLRNRRNVSAGIAREECYQRRRSCASS